MPADLSRLGAPTFRTNAVPRRVEARICEEFRCKDSGPGGHGSVTIVNAVASMKGARRQAEDLAAATPEITALYRTYAGQVERWVTRLAGPAVDAEDVVQEVFLVVQ